MVERRKFIRVHEAIPAAIFPAGSRLRRHRFPATIVNISPLGACVQIDTRHRKAFFRRYRQRPAYELRFGLAQTMQYLHIEVRVMWANEQEGKLGVSFLRFIEGPPAALAKYIEERFLSSCDMADYDNLFDSISDMVLKKVGARACAMFLYAEPIKQYFIKTRKRWPDRQIRRLKQDLAEAVSDLTGEGLDTANIETTMCVNKEGAGKAVDTARMSFCNVPIVVSARCVGVLNTSGAYDDIFGSLNVRYLYMMANRAAIILERLMYGASHLNFIAALSHDLKQPLFCIRSGMELLRDALPLAVRQGRDVKTYFSTIHSNIGRLAAYVNDILDLSRLESGSFRLEAKVISLRPVLRRAMEYIEPMFEKKRVTLSVRKRHAAARFYADAERLQQVLTNLLTNALKFSPPGRTVRLDVRDSKDTITVSVADGGSGIASEDLDKIFDKYQHAAIKDAFIKNSGLGLCICKEIIERSGGRIWVESSLGKGSTFYFTLPKRARSSTG